MNSRKIDQSPRLDIDSLKGIAIIMVILFHCGLLSTAYLGVDLFFVINGYLIIPNLSRKIANQEFSFTQFMQKRVSRLLPLIVIATTVCLSIGYFVMLPDAYENLAETVVASNLMAENLLETLTVKNYWAIANNYKPLMHLWYVGILFQFYLTLPILLLATRFIANKLRINISNALNITVLALFLVSLYLYLSPNVDDCYKFYYLQYRMFEILAGGLIALFPYRIKAGNIFALLLIITLCCGLLDGNTIGHITTPIGAPNTPNKFIAKWILTLTIVALSCLTIAAKPGNKIICNKLFAYIGKRSYSIFIWHQIVIAFYRYTTSNNTFSSTFILSFVAITLLLSEITYRLIEQGIKPTLKTALITIAVDIAVTCCAFNIYKHAGVVRDIPELEVIKGQEHQGMFATYCDRIYSYDSDFPNNGKINVLIEGVSFARDFANVLLESDIAQYINISYTYAWDGNDRTTQIKRIKESDYIFCFQAKSDVPQFVWDNLKPNAKVYGIGTKSFGESNGIIYSHHNSPDYFKQTTPLDPAYADLNTKWRAEWGKDHYIDFIKTAMVDASNIRVFTPDNRYISQDCMHLTHAGAQWYAKAFNLHKIFNLQSSN